MPEDTRVTFAGRTYGLVAEELPPSGRDDPAPFSARVLR